MLKHARRGPESRGGKGQCGISGITHLAKHKYTSDPARALAMRGPVQSAGSLSLAISPRRAGPRSCEDPSHGMQLPVLQVITDGLLSSKEETRPIAGPTWRFAGSCIAYLACQQLQQETVVLSADRNNSTTGPETNRKPDYHTNTELLGVGLRGVSNVDGDTHRYWR
ncbi:hypothetical protein L226DRAFT_536970 [Lentinus tigrinus ALCF2SS1-7]|uniref:Uncharacterized protein n=1 Tax=Lentinus tigrinus ALCF2SS1-6 TaxID=1328759 RepID=A0A5C2S4I1_9APHY|nr:hypothetical protein L227DRAFT_576951 [Lentinus tigrinus ALCF2SS1-6]RPD72798.1 hypothetical protein L226DRAFT_536970 [Lentinus tigrinus ALCF2SS1-7]